MYMKNLIFIAFILITFKTNAQRVLWSQSFKTNKTLSNEISYIKNFGNYSFIVGYQFDLLGKMFNLNQNIIYGETTILHYDKPSWYFENSNITPTYPNSGIYQIGILGNQSTKSDIINTICDYRRGSITYGQKILNFGVGKKVGKLKNSQLFLCIGLSRETEKGIIHSETWTIRDRVHYVYDSWHVINPDYGYRYYVKVNERFDVSNVQDIIINSTKYIPNFKILYQYNIGYGSFGLSYGNREGISLVFGYDLNFTNTKKIKINHTL
jgi:hypothetical protein